MDPITDVNEERCQMLNENPRFCKRVFARLLQHSVQFFVFMAVASLSLDGVALAQGGRRSSPGREGFQKPGREQMEMVRMWRLVNTLEVDEDQAMKVFPAFSLHHRERELLAKRRSDLRKGLQQQLAEEGNDEALLSLMAKIHKVEGEISTLAQEFDKDLEDILTPRQRARLMLFEDDFRNQLQDTVRRMRGMRSGNMVNSERPMMPVREGGR
jgi:Spy/CpxP family protein refolding chaperone